RYNVGDRCSVTRFGEHDNTANRACQQYSGDDNHGDNRSRRWPSIFAFCPATRLVHSEIPLIVAIVATKRKWTAKPRPTSFSTIEHALRKRRQEPEPELQEAIAVNISATVQIKGVDRLQERQSELQEVGAIDHTVAGDVAVSAEDIRRCIWRSRTGQDVI